MELKRAMMVLWKWWRLFIGAFLTVFISTVVFTFTQTPIYETSVRLIVSPSSVLMADLNDLRSAVTALSAPVVTNTYAEISQSPSTVEKAWKLLDIRPQKTYHVISTVLQETTIVNITVSGPDPKLTRDLANAITDQTMMYVEGLTTVYNLTLLDPAVTPELPSKPTYLLNLVLGIIIGLMTGVMLAFMAEYLTASADNRANE
jgi:capsular polysaccharide biosynthesis protein